MRREGKKIGKGWQKWNEGAAGGDGVGRRNNIKMLAALQGACQLSNDY